MPKHVSKDLYFQWLEKRYADPATAKAALDMLRGKIDQATGQPYEIANMGSLTGATAPTGYKGSGQGSPQIRTDHLNNDWFGKQLVNGAWEKYSVNSPSTGWWIEWEGDAEGVFKETLIRALEVAFGIAHDEASPTNPSHIAPIQFFWICGLPRFESYISWRTVCPARKFLGFEIAPATLEVTVLILTPGYTSQAGSTQFDVEDFPSAGAGPEPGLDDYMKNDPGMIFVGQNVGNSTTTQVTMSPGVLVERMHWERGGVGKP
jgi:hypothetical protein